MKGDFVPAKPRIFLAIAAVLAAMVLCFALLLRWDIRSPRRLNPAGYESTRPEGFQCQVAANIEGGALQLRGWAFVEGERLLEVNSWVVVYDTLEERYLRLPTAMELDETPTGLMADGIDYSRGGFVSLTPLKSLGQDLARYELCFAYRSGDHNALVHTGERLEASL